MMGTRCPARRSRTSAGVPRKNSRRRLTRFDSAAGQLVVAAGFEADRVVAEDHGRYVVVEGDGCIAEFPDAVEWF
jgi:hypothetical protein